MDKLVLSLVWFFAANTPAAASNWVQLNLDGRPAFVDLGSISLEGEYRVAWAKVVPLKPEEGVVEVRNLSLYDCRGMRTKYLRFSLTAESGELRNEEAGPSEPWKVVKPNSRSAVLFETVCAHPIE